MKYKTYFDVPDGAMCRPAPAKFISSGNVIAQGACWAFQDKIKWKDQFGLMPHDALGEWETEEKKIEISREDLRNAMAYRSSGGFTDRDMVLYDLFGRD